MEKDIFTERLQQQLSFLYEIDKLKTIIRRNNLIADPERLENSAEHSWHLAFYAVILAEYANSEINIFRVLKMVLLHDLVEIDAGDTFCYDEQAHVGKNEKEQHAAERLFGLLPADQGAEFIALWQEFEAGETADAKFAGSVDRIQPILHNYMTGGGSWKRHDIKKHQVEKRMQPIGDGSMFLAELIESIVNDAITKKILSV
jgi:putative hydrolase of HD superfamily